MPTIALVDDDRNILTSVSLSLEAEGYRVQSYTDGASALDGLKTSPPDLAIFYIKMPRMDGMELLRRLRQKSDLPVIFLTSKDEEIDELFGLKMGADDFIRKPFSQRLLVERVKAVLRRSRPDDSVRELHVADMKVDLIARSVERAGRTIALQPREFRLLAYLLLHQGRVVTRTMLLEAVWDYRFDPQTNVIDVHISRLRSKIDKDASVALIHTVRGVGYTLSPAGPTRELAG